MHLELASLITVWPDLSSENLKKSQNRHVGVSDLGGSFDELDCLVGVFSDACKATRHLHILPSTSPSIAAFRRKIPLRSSFWSTGSRNVLSRLEPLYIGSPADVNTTSWGFLGHFLFAEVFAIETFLWPWARIGFCSMVDLLCLNEHLKDKSSFTDRSVTKLQLMYYRLFTYI